MKDSCNETHKKIQVFISYCSPYSVLSSYIGMACCCMCLRCEECEAGALKKRVPPEQTAHLNPCTTPSTSEREHPSEGLFQIKLRYGKRNECDAASSGIFVAITPKLGINSLQTAREREQVAAIFEQDGSGHSSCLI